MADLWTERLEPAGRLTTLEERQNPREQNSRSRRRPPPAVSSEQKPDAEEPPEETKHQLDRMA